MAHDENKSRDDLIEEIKLLKKDITRLESKNTLTRKQKLRLAIFDRIPFTAWACDHNFKIVIWDGNCEETYGYSEEQALGKNYLELFVDPPEREESRKECLKTINDNLVQKNCLAYDRARDGSRRTVLTNCFRIFDEDNNQYLQAEVALEISALQLSIDKLHSLREAGIERLAWIKRTVEIVKRDLINRIDTIHSTILNKIISKRDALDQWFDKIRVKEGEENAHLIIDEHYQKLELTKRILVDRCESVKNKINIATSTEDLDELDKEVNAIESQDYFHDKH